MTIEGDGVLGTDGQGKGEDGKFSANRDTEGNITTCCGEEMASGEDTAAPPSALRRTAEGGRGGIKQVSTQRNSDGTNGARPKHGALARRKYGLLVPAGTVVDPYNVGDPGSEAGHGATEDQDGRELEEEGDKTQQRALPVRGNNGIGDEARGPPPNSRARLMCASAKGGGEEGDPPPSSVYPRRAVGSRAAVFTLCVSSRDRKSVVSSRI